MKQFEGIMTLDDIPGGSPKIDYGEVTCSSPPRKKESVVGGCSSRGGCRGV